MNGLQRLWQKLVAQVARVVLVLLAWVPLPLLLGFGRIVASLVFIGWGKRRRIAMENLLRCRVAESEADARRLARESFHTFVLMVLETLVVRRRLTADNWREFVEFKLSPEVETLLLDPKRGLLVASAHLGNWEVAARAVSMLKPVFVVYRPFKNPELDRVVHAGRTGENLRLVSRNERNPMRFLEALTRGEMVALMIDQHVGTGIPVEFFGRTAMTTPSVAMMHLTTRAPLVLAVAVRTGPLRYEVHAVGPVTAQRTGNREHDALALTQALTREIEQFVRRFPGQYMWGHRRWRAEG